MIPVKNARTEHWKRVAALGLVLRMVTLVPASASGFAPSVGATATETYVRLLGDNANARVTLVSGARLSGSIVAIGETDFELSTRDGLRQIAYDSVADVRSAKRSYKAKSSTDPLEVRRAVTGLGVGKHVAVGFRNQPTVRGHIEHIGSDEFALRTDAGSSQQIAYADVREINENMRLRTKIILIAIAVGVLAPVLYAANYDQ